MMKKRFIVGMAFLLSVLFTSADSSHAEVKADEPLMAVTDNQTEALDFNADIQSIDDLHDEVDDTVEGETYKTAEIRDENGVVYRMPESCREFSKFLENKQASLIKREKDLEQREKLLAKMQAEFETLMGRYSSVEKQIKDLVQRDPSNLKDNPELAKMIKLYEGLAPEEAAARLRNLDLDFTLALLRGMKPKKLGQIMAALEPKLAAALSSQIVRGF